jgi:predicted HAD superfamily phosphohydrolase YqeG
MTTMHRSDSTTAVRRRRVSRPSLLIIGDAEPSSRLMEDIIMTNLAQLFEIPVSAIDKTDSFIGLGGHSLLAVKLSTM